MVRKCASSSILHGFSLLCLIAAMASCFPAKKLAQAKPLPEMRAETLIDRMDSAAIRCRTLSAKIAANAEVNDKSQAFSINLRMRSDSVIWLSVSALGIEAARFLITRDSIKMLDRINSKYMMTDYSYLNNMLQIGVDFTMLQEMLLGNYFSYLDAKKLRSSYVDDQLYILSTLRKGKLKRAMEEKEFNKRIIQDVWLDPESARIVKMAIDDNKMNKKLIVSRDGFSLAESESGIDTVSIAHHLAFKLQAEQPASLDIQMSKVIVNKDLEFPFSIPDKYERTK